jgi:hypothetical protein
VRIVSTAVCLSVCLSASSFRSDVSVCGVHTRICALQCMSCGILTCTHTAVTALPVVDAQGALVAAFPQTACLQLYDPTTHTLDLQPLALTVWQFLTPVAVAGVVPALSTCSTRHTLGHALSLILALQTGASPLVWVVDEAGKPLQCLSPQHLCCVLYGFMSCPLSSVKTAALAESGSRSEDKGKLMSSSLLDRKEERPRDTDTVAPACTGTQGSASVSALGSLLRGSPAVQALPSNVGTFASASSPSRSADLAIGARMSPSCPQIADPSGESKDVNNGELKRRTEKLEVEAWQRGDLPLRAVKGCSRESIGLGDEYRCG